MRAGSAHTQATPISLQDSFSSVTCHYFRTETFTKLIPVVRSQSRRIPLCEKAKCLARSKTGVSLDHFIPKLMLHCQNLRRIIFWQLCVCLAKRSEFFT